MVDKKVDMELHVDRPGFFHTNISLHKLSPRTEKPIKKPEKTHFEWISFWGAGQDNGEE